MFSEKSLTVLEFDKVKEKLAEHAPTDGARMRALSLMPACEYDEVVRRQEKTEAAKRLLSSKGFPHFGGKESVADSAERAMKGASLSTSELLDIASLLFSVRSTLDYIHTDKPYVTVLDPIFERLVPNRNLEEKIRRTIISEDIIADEATPELSDIRKKIRAENNKIKDTLQNYMGGERLKYLQENIVTMRDGRYVIPVKAEYRSEVKGLLHDTSASGATLFVEPIAVVEANNRLKLLYNKEKAEIDRILWDLSSLCADFGNQIILNYETITELAFWFTCASYAVEIRANFANIAKERKIRLIRARHPLIAKERVVPIDVSLGVDFDTMIITGPNTGGKTVTLKTLGLFVIMAQAGLQIPADESSEIGIFSGVLADIGDEQSIAASLSTFSSHMVNIVTILSRIDADTLVLFDELGAGTDPIEGAALAVSIIEYVRRAGALSASTTHYAELKAYAIDTESVENASCEFDVDTLAPTYRLIVGAPGKSNAFAISEKLGLPSDIVNRAKFLVSSDNKNFENVIEKLENSRAQMEKDRQKAEKIREELEEFKRNEEKRLEQKVAESEKEIEKSRQKAKELYDSARATSDYVLKELDKLKKQKEQSDFARAFNEAKNDIRNRLRDGLDFYDRTAPKEIGLDDDYVLPRPLKVGDSVYIRGIGKTGNVTALSDSKGFITVKAGIITAKVKENELMLSDDVDLNEKNSKVGTQGRIGKVKLSSKSRNIGSSTLNASSKSTFTPELDLRGMYADDAWFATDKFLDNAVLSGVGEVRIIHGKGTGVLRRAIQENLKLDTRVKSFRNGVFGEGDLGVTIVTLK
ncbi:MAG: endonuclease MutS2 [Eubacteriales bacterium]|nr:endonuclease MutS2 [Eubacteriales bacterium]